MSKIWKRTRDILHKARCDCKFMGKATEDRGKRSAKIQIANTHSIKMHMTWWRKCMCKGGYIVVRPMNEEQREKGRGRQDQS